MSIPKLPKGLKLVREPAVMPRTRYMVVVDLGAWVKIGYVYKKVKGDKHFTKRKPWIRDGAGLGWLHYRTRHEAIVSLLRFKIRECKTAKDNELRSTLQVIYARMTVPKRCQSIGIDPAMKVS